MDVSSDDAVYKLAIFLSILNLLGVVLLTPFISQMCKALNRFRAKPQRRCNRN